MLTSIGKYTKSFFVKVLVGIIILPFVFWGMGDIFSGGNQNIIATIDSEKISSQEFVNYLQRINLSEEERKDIAKTDLLERILSEYTGRKIIALEIEDMGIILSDSSLKNIITNDDAFKKDGKFSRTKYEKFLIESSLSAPAFEENIAEQEKKRQLLNFLSKGTTIPEFLVENEFKKENQIKEVRYLDLNEYFDKQITKKEDIKKIYDKNKALFVEQFKSFSFVELKPEILTSKKNYDEVFFKKIDEIENEILDGMNVSNIAQERNLKITNTKEINYQKRDISGKEIAGVPEELFKKIFIKQKINKPELIEINNKYYLAEISSISNKDKSIDDKMVNEAISSQLKVQYKLELNTKITKEISEGNFDINNMINFGNKNNIKINDYTIRSLADNDVFSKGIIKRIYETSDNKIILITDSKLTKNFLVFIKKTNYQKLVKDSDVYKKNLTKARLNIANKIYTTYDVGVNNKYNVTLNNKVIERIKNSF